MTSLLLIALLASRATAVRVSDGDALRAALADGGGGIGGDIELAADIDLLGKTAEVGRDVVVNGNGHAVRQWAGAGFFTVAPGTAFGLEDLELGRSGATQPTRAPAPPGTS